MSADIDEAQDARLDRIDTRLRAVEEMVVELRTLTKLAKPILMVAAASLGVDIAPMVL
ncbi:MAG: hypothetical protein ACXADL_16125 [Candidatus Thorarchaeota archaeon]|jgi:hypothetical protein